MEICDLELGKLYKFRADENELKYIGNNWSGNGYWHQFEKDGYDGVWCELANNEIRLIEPILNSDVVITGAHSRVTRLSEEPDMFCVISDYTKNIYREKDLRINLGPKWPVPRKSKKMK
jgi:hypothetical protein